LSDLQQRALDLQRNFAERSAWTLRP